MKPSVSKLSDMAWHLAKTYDIANGNEDLGEFFIDISALRTALSSPFWYEILAEQYS